MAGNLDLGDGGWQNNTNLAGDRSGHRRYSKPDLDHRHGKTEAQPSPAQPKPKWAKCKTARSVFFFLARPRVYLKGGFIYHFDTRSGRGRRNCNFHFPGMSSASDSDGGPFDDSVADPGVDSVADPEVDAGIADPIVVGVADPEVDAGAADSEGESDANPVDDSDVDSVSEDSDAGAADSEGESDADPVDDSDANSVSEDSDADWSFEVKPKPKSSSFYDGIFHDHITDVTKYREAIASDFNEKSIEDYCDFLTEMRRKAQVKSQKIPLDSDDDDDDDDFQDALQPYRKITTSTVDMKDETAEGKTELCQQKTQQQTKD